LIRTFIAVTLAKAVIEEIAKVRTLLQEPKGDIRWTRIEGLHLTLKFLGNIERSQVEMILAVLQDIAQQHSPLRIVAQGLGTFPNLRRPRVLWVGLQGERINKLSEAIESALLPLKFPPEEREFTPHLTLGRIRSSRGWERVLPILKAHKRAYFGESVIDHMTLYQSDLRPDGPIYIPLGVVSFQPGI
jgi:2'-5' RNA ligase